MKTMRKLIVLLLIFSMTLSCLPMAAFATEVGDIVQLETTPVETAFEEPVPQDETEPVGDETEPVPEETEPIVEETEPVIEETEPVVEETEPVIDETEPVIEETEPVIEETEPVVVEMEPIVEETAPAVSEEEVSSPAMMETKTTEDGFLYEIVNDETVTITGYTSTATELVIPSELDGKPVVEIGEKAFYQNEKIISVVIPGSVKHIGTSAFHGCEAIKSISLQEGLQTIGEDAFIFTKIEDIFLPGSLKSIGENAFWQCTSLSNAYITDISHYLGLQTTYNFAHLYLNGELVTELVIPADITSLPDYAFSGCTDITSVVLPEGLEIIGKYAFADCKSLTSIVIPSSIQSIGHAAFSSCYVLQKVYLPNVETWFQVSLDGNYSSPLSVGSSSKEVYFGGELLTELTIPQEMTEIPDFAFSSCQDLCKLIIPDSVTSIGQSAFSGTGITELVIPEGVVSIGDRAFERCSKLTSIEIPDSLETVGSYAFNYCTKLTDIYVSDIAEWLTIKWSQNNSLMLANTLDKNIFENGEPITDVVLPEGVKGIPEKSFSRVKSLTSIYIPDSVKGIGDRAFEYCTNLQAVSVGFGVSSISMETFKQCTNLNCLFLPDTVENVFRDAFAGCNKLTCIVYSGTNEQLQNMSVFRGNDILYEVGWHIEGSCCTPNVDLTISPDTGRPTLTWDDAPCVVGWAVYRSTSATKDYELLDIVYDTSYTDLTEANGKQYYYIVGGISLMGIVGSASDYKVASIPCTAPELTMSTNSSGYPCITWEKVSGAKQYEVYYATSENGSYTKLTTTSKTSYTHSKAESGKGYYYKVRVIGSSSSLNSAFSAPIYGVRKLAKPTLTVSVNSAGKPVITWKAIANALEYELQVKCNDGEYQTLITTKDLRYTHLEVEVGNAYTYRARAISEKEELTGDYGSGQTVNIKCAKPIMTLESDPVSGKPVISWNTVDGAVNYQIYYATSSKGTYKKLAETDALSFTHTKAATAKTYYYKVRAVDQNGIAGTYCSAKSVVCKCATPEITVAAKVSSGKPVIKWSKVSGAKKYTVYRATSETGKYTALKTTTSTSYTDTAAKVGTTYYYKVKALASSKTFNSAYSQITSFVPICGQPAVSISISSATGKPSLSWKAISGAVSYDIYRATSADGPFELLVNQTGVTFSDTTAAPETNYWYKVNALGAQEALNSVDGVAKKAYATLARPDVTFSIDSKTGKPKLSWDAVDGATSYKIYRSSYSKKKYKAIKTVTDTEFLDTSVKVAKGYYYKVIAIGENSKSAYSSYKKLTAKCAQPQVTATQNSAGKPYLTWGKVSGAKKYYVYRVDENGSRTSLGTTTKTYFADKKAALGTTYTYQVRAYGSKSAYKGAYSESVSCLCICSQPTVTVSVVAATGKPTLSWKAIPGAVSYEIYRSENDGEYAKVSAQTTTSYTDEAAILDSKYSYKVIAIAQNPEWNSAESAAKSIYCACGNPTITGTRNGKKPMVSWEPVEGATKYYVYRSTKKSSGYKKVATVEGESYTDKKAKKGTTYYYKVIAVSENTSSAYSNYAKIKSK